MKVEVHRYVKATIDSDKLRKDAGSVYLGMESEAEEGIKRGMEAAGFTDVHASAFRSLPPAEFVQLVFNYINGASGSAIAKALNEHMASEHPTLQQGFVRTLVRPALEAMDKIAYVDGRNEAAKQFARAAVEATRGMVLPIV